MERSNLRRNFASVPELGSSLLRIASRVSVAWMPVLRSVGCCSLQVSLRLRGAGYRRYSCAPKVKIPQTNRHWFRHVLVAFSPGGIIPLPFPILLGFQEGKLASCYHLGMLRYYLLEACKPDMKYLLSFKEDILRRLDDDTEFLVEDSMLKYWVQSIARYVSWYESACCDSSVTIEDLLDPPPLLVSRYLGIEVAFQEFWIDRAQ